MRSTLLLGVLLGVFCLAARGADFVDDWLNHVDDALTLSIFHQNIRARISGLADLEGYYFDRPAPGLIETDRNRLFNPRLTLYVDVQGTVSLWIRAGASGSRI